MVRSRLSHILLAAALTTCLATLPAWASPAAPANEPTSLAQAWSFFGDLWVEIGCTFDPHGCPATQSSSKADVGCTADPHGGCASDHASSTAEAGCWLDPYGLCLRTQSSPESDVGCTLDPHGGCSH